MKRASTVADEITSIALAALTAASATEAMRSVTEELRRAIGADNALYHEFDQTGWAGIHGITPEPAWEALPLHGAPTAELRAIHPGVDHICRNRAVAPFVLSEIVSEQKWRRYEFFNLLKPVWGRTLKLHITVGDTRAVARGWALTRDGSDYSRADLELAQKLQPVLDVVARQYVAARELPAVDRGVLTEREHVVLTLMSSGMTAAAAGRRLGISGRTVTKHLERIYRKLDAGDRVSALRAADALGLLGGDPALAGSRRGGDLQLF